MKWTVDKLMVNELAVAVLTTEHQGRRLYRASCSVCKADHGISPAAATSKVTDPHRFPRCSTYACWGKLELRHS